MIRRVSRVLMVAVVLAAGGLSGYLAAVDAFEHAAHGDTAAHAHHHLHAHHHYRAIDIVEVSVCTPESCDEQGSAEPTCEQMHVHCCSAYTAVQAGDCVLKLALRPHAIRPDAGFTAPRGLLSYPPLRPPSATA